MLRASWHVYSESGFHIPKLTYLDSLRLFILLGVLTAENWPLSRVNSHSDSRPKAIQEKKKKNRDKYKETVTKNLTDSH